jgi:hypothetical protein
MRNVTFGPSRNVTGTVINAASEKVSTDNGERLRSTTSSAATSYGPSALRTLQVVCAYKARGDERLVRRSTAKMGR